MIAKGTVAEGRIEADNTLVTGTETLTANGKFSIYTGEGPVHGKLTLLPDAVPDGVWNCNWTGYRTKTGESEWTANIKIEGHGEGGEIDGMMIFFNETVHTSDLFGQNGYLASAVEYIKSK